MASSDATPLPIKNQAYRVTFPIFNATGDLVTGAAGLDSEVSKDGGTFADCASEATEIATASGVYYLDLTSTEMNADTVAIIVKTSTSGAKTTPIVLYPAENTDIPVNVTVMANGVITAAVIATDAIDNDAIAANAVTEIQAGLATAASITALNNLSAAQVWAAATRTLTASLDPAAAAIVTQLLATTIEGRTFEEILKDIWAQTTGDAVADNATTPTLIVYEGPDGTTQVTHTITPTTRVKS